MSERLDPSPAIDTNPLAARLRRLPSVELHLLRGTAREQQFDVPSLAFLFGAAPDSDFVLDGRLFPESYAYLIRAPEGVALRWLGEGPEARVNGRALGSRAPLHDGACVEFGPYLFRVYIGWPGRRVRRAADASAAEPTAHVRLLRQRSAWQQRAAELTAGGPPRVIRLRGGERPTGC